MLRASMIFFMLVVASSEDVRFFDEHCKLKSLVQAQGHGVPVNSFPYSFDNAEFRITKNECAPSLGKKTDRIYLTGGVKNVFDQVSIVSAKNSNGTWADLNITFSAQFSDNFVWSHTCMQIKGSAFHGKLGWNSPYPHKKAGEPMFFEWAVAKNDTKSDDDDDDDEPISKECAQWDSSSYHPPAPPPPNACSPHLDPLKKHERGLGTAGTWHLAPGAPKWARKPRSDTQEIAKNIWHLFYGGAS
jgi:hypothetical protein